MKWWKNLKKRVAKVFGAATEESAPPPIPAHRLDQGPCTAWYLRRKLPNSVFTKAWTPARQQTMLEFLRHLRPEQRELVYRRGWNKGVRV